MYRTMTELFKRMDDAKEEKEFAVAFSYLEVNLYCFLVCFFLCISTNKILFGFFGQNDFYTLTKEF